jgi:pimeloyl-ACP methyl ester carboxylesterase
MDLRAHDLLLRGMRIRYFEAGEGPPLFLVHGFIVHSGVWSQVIPALAKHFRVIALDLPGSGGSERPREYRYDREAFAETVCDLMAGLDIPRAHIAGHSLGGAVALTLAADHPERVDRLAVINSQCYPFELPVKGRIPLVPIIGEFIFKQLYVRPMFHAYFRDNVFAPGFQYDRAAIDSFYRAFNTPDGRDAAYRVLRSTVDMVSLGPRIAKVRAPALVLWGELDPLFPLDLGMRLARDLPRARLETLPGVGHSPIEERPEAAAALLVRHFLDGA